jgi:hypothetical protein
MRRALAALCLPLAIAACDNAGADRTLGISAAGIVRGQVYFDANGSRTFDATDVPFPGARIRLLTPVSRDTVLRATTGADGTYRITDVPVGSYEIVIDSASAGDSAFVVSGSRVAVQVLPADSVEHAGSISFLIRSIAEARTLAPGTRLFVTAIALNERATFSDTTLHLVDTSGAIRATRVRPSAVPVSTGDSVRVRARVAQRLGQRVLDDVSVFVVNPTFIPTAATLTTASAATADGAGARDAELVRLIDAAVVDTATIAGSLRITMDDGSGPVFVLLDRSADVAFRPPPPGEYVVPNRFDITGVLVPTGTGAWIVKPRSALDILRR